MNILFISDNKILGYGGGSIENKKYYHIIKKYAKQHGDNFRVISPDNNLEESLIVKIRKNKCTDILVRLKGHSSFLYDVWKQNKTMIKEYKPDIIILGRSRLGFIAEDVKTNFNNCIVVTNVDNVECDFVEFCFTEKKGLFNSLKYWLEKKCVISDEKKVVKYSDRLIFLTKRNYERYKEVYNYQSESYEVLPIALENIISLKKKENCKSMVFVGSLDYLPNILTVKKILHEIFIPYFEEFNSIKLIIAGRNPSDELEKEILSIKNVELYKDFENISDIIPEGSLILCPIEKGAGMKVKVAESLAMGAMIAASDEALVGYENAVNCLLNQSIFLCNNTDDFVKTINKYLNMDNETVRLKTLINKEIFLKYYSYDFAYEVFLKVMQTIRRVR